MTLTHMRESRESVSRQTWPDFAFTEEQWNEIAKLGDIPPLSADEELLRPGRRMLEVNIGLYQLRKRLRASVMAPAKVRDELAATEGYINEARERLRQLEERQPVGWQLSFGKMIEALCEQERELRLIKNDVATEVPQRPRKGQKGGTRPRRPEMDVYYLVRNACVGVWREYHNGETISASRKSNNRLRKFIEMILRIADPDIGDATIDRAIARPRSR
jgi:hypothetical protein